MSTSQSYTFGPKKICEEWAMGTCSHGDACLKYHHPDLDPILVQNREHREYMVPSNPGQACDRCLQTEVTCDKAERDGDKNPCSECRHFGGANPRCILNAYNSYNEQVWQALMNQVKNGRPAILPAVKSRLDTDKGPAARENLRLDWIGATRDELLARPDTVLPDFVRQKPRAYIQPPTRSRKAEKWEKELERRSIKRSLGSEELSSFSPGQTPPAYSISTRTPGYSATRVGVVPTTTKCDTFPPAQGDPPAPHVIHGDVIGLYWCYLTRSWTYHYRDGSTSGGPSEIPRLPAYAHRAAPVHPRHSIGSQHGHHSELRPNKRLRTQGQRPSDPARPLGPPAPVECDVAPHQQDAQMENEPLLAAAQLEDKAEESEGYQTSADGM